MLFVGGIRRSGRDPKETVAEYRQGRKFRTMYKWQNDIQRPLAPGPDRGLFLAKMPFSPGIAFTHNILGY